MRRNLFLAALIGALTLPAIVAAQPVQQNNSNAVWFENWIGLSNANMRVATPEGDITDVRAEVGTPVFELATGEAMDGVYRYELRASTEEMVKNRDYDKDAEAGQENEEFVAKQLYKTGLFFVERGLIVKHEGTEESKASD